MIQFFIRIVTTCFLLGAHFPVFALDGAENKVNVSSPTQVEKNSSKAKNNEAGASRVLAIVNEHKITQEDLENSTIYPLRSISDPILRSQAQNKILLEVVDEYLVEDEIANGQLKNNSLFNSLMGREKRRAAVNLYQTFVASSGGTKVTPAMVDAFIKTHEEYFSKRRTWHFYQFVIPPLTNSSLSLEEVQKASKTFDLKQFADWLTEKGVDFERTNLWQGSEQLAPDVLAGLSQLKPGGALVTAGKSVIMNKTSLNSVGGVGGYRVIYLLDSYVDPLDSNEAKNSVARNLIGQANKLKIAEAMDELRSKSKVSFIGVPGESEAALITEFSKKRVSERTQYQQIEYFRIIWFFFVSCVIPLALLQFYRYVPSISRRNSSLRQIQKLEQKSFIRALEALLFGLLLLYPMFIFLISRFADYSTRVIAVSGLIGLLAAGALVYTIRKVAALNELNQSRFLPIIVLLVAQYIVAAI